MRISRLPSVLLVDDDQGVRDTIGYALRSAGLHATAITSGRDAIAAMKICRFDLLLIDQWLPDLTGIETVRAIRLDGLDLPFVLFSGGLTVTAAVDALRLGAADVLEKPFTVDHLIAIVRSVLDARANVIEAARGSGRPESLTRPRSAAERWAALALRGCQSDGDLRTLDDWAQCAGVSYTSLRESCRLVSMRPYDARDFVRVLRAVIVATVNQCPPAVLLDVADSRTLAHLLGRAGFRNDSVTYISVEQFFRLQRFVPTENEALRVLRTYLVAC